MKPFQFAPFKFFFVVIASAFLLTTSTTYAGGNGSEYNARLVVHRAADFGTLIYLNLFVDGVQVTMLPQSVGYEALLTPGDHLLAVSTTPSPYGKTRYTYKHVKMRPGETYAYTAIWEYADVAQLDNSRMVDLIRTYF